MNPFAKLLMLALVVCVPAGALSAGEGKPHRLAMQVTEDNPDKMNMVLNNARNAIEYFEAKGEKIEVQVVAYGPGLHMFRDDTSPVKERLTEYRGKYKGVTFAACRNTMEGMGKREGKKIVLVGEAVEVATGVGHLIELQEQGWSYVRP